MRFVRTAITFLLVASVVVTVACSSGSSDDSADTREDGTTPATDATTTETTPAPAQSPSRATATPPPPKAPTFAPGAWTAGEAVAQVSGGVSLTVRQASSRSSRRMTQLTEPRPWRRPRGTTLKISDGRNFRPIRFKGAT